MASPAVVAPAVCLGQDAVHRLKRARHLQVRQAPVRMARQRQQRPALEALEALHRALAWPVAGRAGCRAASSLHRLRIDPERAALDVRGDGQEAPGRLWEPGGAKFGAALSPLQSSM